MHCLACVSEGGTLQTAKAARLNKEKEQEQLRVERELQEALDQKHRQLEASQEKHQEALRENLHRQQVSMLDEEIKLIDRQLDETHQKDVSDYPALHVSRMGDRAVFLSDLNEMVRSLVHQSVSKSLRASEIAEFYRRHCGRDLQLDANHFIGKSDGSRMAFRQIFEAVACGEIAPPAKPGKWKRTKQGLVIRLVETKETSQISVEPSASRVSRIHNMVARVENATDESIFLKKHVSTTKLRFEKLPPHLAGGTSQSSERDENSVVDREISSISATEMEGVDLWVPRVSVSSELHVESQSANSFEVSAAVLDIVKRFIDDGAVAADNLLDEIKGEASSNASSEIQSLQYVIGEDLDRSGNHSRPPGKSGIDDSLCEAVCLYAYALYCYVHEFPLQAQQYVGRMLEIVKNNDLHLPKDWLERAQKLSRVPDPDTASRKRRKMEDTPEDKWSLVLTSDYKAPAVMDSILPMTGLTDVKNSMIGMYHRIKLAQEQNDGVAASYNIRFEGNPGTGYVHWQCPFDEFASCYANFESTFVAKQPLPDVTVLFCRNFQSCRNLPYSRKQVVPN